MAVSRMRKIQILAHKGAKDKMVSALREEGALHITDPTIEFERGSDEEARRDNERDLQARQGKLEHLKDFLKPYIPKEKKTLDTMFNPRVVLEPDELAGILEGFDLDEWYERVIELESAMRGAEAEIGRKQSLAAELTHWVGVEAAVEELTDTRLVSVALVTVESSDVADLTTELTETTNESDLVEVSSAGSSTYLAVLFLKSAESSVLPVLKRYNARWVNLAGATVRFVDTYPDFRLKAADVEETVTDRNSGGGGRRADGGGGGTSRENRGTQGAGGRACARTPHGPGCSRRRS